MSPDPAVTSLRRTLLRRLAAPLSMLALMSGLIAYWLAWQYTQHVVDRSLADLASAISKQIQIAGPDAPFTVPPLAQAMFSDPTEQLIYRISDGEHELAGDPKLPLQGTSVRRMHVAYVFEAEYDNQAVRVAQVRVAQTESGNPMIVEVAQPVRYRYRIAAEFLIAIMMPLLLLLLAGWGIVWRVVNQQLGPLTHLADSLNRQTHTSLEPVDETEVPLEIRPLTSAMNALLGRLKTALDAQRKFIADAAHQLRTPLTAIKLHAEQAAVARDPQQALTAVRELRSAADRAVRLSNQLLSLARAEPGEQAARIVEGDQAARGRAGEAVRLRQDPAASIEILNEQRSDQSPDAATVATENLECHRGSPRLVKCVKYRYGCFRTNTAAAPPCRVHRRCRTLRRCASAHPIRRASDTPRIRSRLRVDIAVSIRLGISFGSIGCDRFAARAASRTAGCNRVADAGHACSSRLFLALVSFMSIRIAYRAAARIPKL